MTRGYLVYLMGLFYVGAGINHFIYPYFYAKMIRDFIPFPLAVIYISGIIEILLGIGVCIPYTQSISAIGIIILLIAVFPANIYISLYPEKWKYRPIFLYLRLPLQAILIYWAYLYI